MVSVSFVSVIYLLTLRSASCLETWEKNFTVQHTLNGVSLSILEANPGRSLALAPFIFRLSLCKLAVVAIGDTKKELLSFLEIKRPEEAIRCFSDMYSEIYRLMETDMTIFSKIYVNYTNDIDKTFLSDSSLYGVGVGKVGFHFKQGAVNFVNNEIDERTYRRIRNVLKTNDINDDSSILLVNGIQIKPTWEHRFDIKKTSMKTFRLLNKTEVRIPMMNSVFHCNYMRDDAELFSAISMHLAIYGVTATFIVTDPDKNIVDLLTILSQKPDSIESIKKRMKWQTVNVFLPKFRIKMALDWTDYLKSVGLNLTLSKTNKGLKHILNKITPYNMYVSKAKQKVFLDIDEMGSYRHGAGGEIMEAGRMGSMIRMINDNLPQFVADRPFYFAISMSGQNGTTVDVVNGAYYGIDELDV